MRLWPWALGGLGIWAAHFFTLYALGSVFETSTPARIGTLVATVVAIGANLWLLGRAQRRKHSDGDQLNNWIAGLSQLGAGLSLIAVAWQGLVAALI